MYVNSVKSPQPQTLFSSIDKTVAVACDKIWAFNDRPIPQVLFWNSQTYAIKVVLGIPGDKCFTKKL